MKKSTAIERLSASKQDYLSVCDLLEKRFEHTKVDVVTIKGLSPFVGETILKEVGDV